MTDEDRTGTDDTSASAGAAGGGAWLTYRYRLGGEGTAEATGTMKAPSFLSAARRILARGLGATIDPGPAYLRLRAAGEQETLFRVSRTGPGASDALHVEIVPSATYTFAEGADLPPAGHGPTSPAPDPR
jgi:hypothetical protein